MSDTSRVPPLKSSKTLRVFEVLRKPYLTVHAAALGLGLSVVGLNNQGG